MPAFPERPPNNAAPPWVSVLASVVFLGLGTARAHADSVTTSTAETVTAVDAQDDEEAEREWNRAYDERLRREREREDHRYQLQLIGINVVAIGTILTAALMQRELLVQADRMAGDDDVSVPASYRRMQRALSPVAAVGGVFALTSVVLGTDHRPAMPDALAAVNMVAGIACMVAGVVFWARPADRIGSTSEHRPVHQGGTLAFSVGVPMFFWGARDMLDNALSHGHH